MSHCHRRALQCVLYAGQLQQQIHHRFYVQQLRIVGIVVNSFGYHGLPLSEKLYETLLNREEMAQAEDLGEYYRVPADTRDLNYSKFFTKGETVVSEAVDYNSHNTKLLDVEVMMDLLQKLPCVQDALKGAAVTV